MDGDHPPAEDQIPQALPGSFNEMWENLNINPAPDASVYQQEQVFQPSVTSYPIEEHACNELRLYLHKRSLDMGLDIDFQDPLLDKVKIIESYLMKSCFRGGFHDSDVVFKEMQVIK